MKPDIKQYSLVAVRRKINRFSWSDDICIDKELLKTKVNFKRHSLLRFFIYIIVGILGCLCVLLGLILLFKGIVFD